MKLLLLTVFYFVVMIQCKPKLDCELPLCLIYWTPEQCFKEGKAWVPADCDTKCTACAIITDVVKKYKCDPPSCKHKCKDQTPDDCKAKQVLVPKDNSCWYCNKCVDGVF